MATRAQRKAHQLYALKVVEGLVNPRQWAYAEIAAVLTQLGVFTPLGTVVWTPRLVTALLVWDAFCNRRSWGLLWTMGALEEAAGEFEGIPNEPQEGRIGIQAQKSVEWADDVLHGRASVAEESSLLPPAHQAAYRDYALGVVAGLKEGPLAYSIVATVLTHQAVPTPDGHTKWQPIQVQRLLVSLEQWDLAQCFVSGNDPYIPWRHEEEKDDEHRIENDAMLLDDKDLPF